MKTKEEIKSQIEQTINEAKKLSQEKEIKKAQKKVKFLNDCIAYIETNPREEYTKKALKKIRVKISEVKAECKAAMNKEIAKIIKADAGYNKLMSQLKTLEYIS